MTRHEVYTCDRCQGANEGGHGFMNPAPLVAVDHSGAFPIMLNEDFEHICEPCATDLDDLLVAAIEEWRANK